MTVGKEKDLARSGKAKRGSFRLENTDGGYIEKEPVSSSRLGERIPS